MVERIKEGGSLENTVVLSEQGIVNQSGLRFPNEFVRHKILDLMEDVALLGFPSSVILSRNAPDMRYIPSSWSKFSLSPTSGY